MTMGKREKTRMIEKRERKKILRFIADILLIILPPALCFYLLECYSHNPFAEVRPWAQFFNILLFELCSGICFCLTGRLKWAYRILFSGAMIYGIANTYVVRFRTNPIVPWDILSIKTAASVAGNYDFTPDVRMVVVTLAFALLIFLSRFCSVTITRRPIWQRVVSAAVLTAALCMFAHVLQKEDFQNSHRLYNKLFTPVFMTDVDGMAVTFTMNLAYMSIDKPQGYDRAEAEEILEGYGSDDGEELPEELPNLIVVMNEAFSDLAVLGNVDANEDYMPFVHSLQKGADNTVTGMLNVSVCGGNTANTEFEFLTGNTMAFLPQGSVPYQQYVNGEMTALPEHLRNLGYETVAAHPYYAGGWERDTVYPWLGFERSIFKNDYLMPKYLRQYVSDESCVEKLIECYETKEKGKPLFAFNVTMQNHGGYQDTYDNFTPDIAVEDSSNVSLNQYLSLIKRSDAALKHLVDYFSNVEEKTVIVFFGDHQPSDTVAATILAKNGMAWNHLTEEELKLRYQVPYVIWANYEMAEETGADTSANYLAAEVLQRVGVPLNAYQNYLLEVKQQYPVISAVRTVRADGSETSAAEEHGTMDSYRRLQYYEVFDKE